MPAPVTIYDIATELSLSPSTISRALNDDPKINIKTRQRVREAAERMDYTVNSLAASLRGGSSRTIGIVLPRINRNFFANAVAGMEEVARAAGYRLVITQSYEQIELEAGNITTLVGARVDGIIISLSLETDCSDHFELARKRNIPIVFFDRTRPDLGTNVVLDDFEAARQATVHLGEQGYASIGHLGGPEHVSVYAERHRGYRAGLEESGMAYDPAIVFRTNTHIATGYAACRELHGAGKLPEALFCASDYGALGASRYCGEHEISVPGQMGLVGFANEFFTEIMSPALTTVEQFSHLLGQEAARLLLEQIGSGGAKKPRREVKIAPRLVIRESSVRR